MYHGGAYFSWSIPSEERQPLHDVICQLDPWSIIGQFAFGRYAPEEGTGTEVMVTKPWHQERDLHMTVVLQYIDRDS